MSEVAPAAVTATETPRLRKKKARRARVREDVRATENVQTTKGVQTTKRVQTTEGIQATGRLGEQPPVAPDQTPLAIDQRRREKLNEIQLDALRVHDPLQSALRATAADLLAMSYRINGLIRASLDEAGDVSRLAEVTPAIDLYLKIARQADRFAQIDQRLSAAQRAQATSVQAAREPAGNGAFDTHRAGLPDSDAPRE